MTTKFINLQKISIRPQNDHEKILIKNFQDLILSGKKPCIEYLNGDLLVSIKSEK